MIEINTNICSNIEEVEITNSSFRLTDLNKNQKSFGIDYSNLDLTQIVLAYNYFLLQIIFIPNYF